MTTTIVCIGGWKYTGTIIEENKSSLLKIQWIKIKTHKGTVSINTDHIVSIIHGNIRTSRK